MQDPCYIWLTLKLKLEQPHAALELFQPIMQVAPLLEQHSIQGPICVQYLRILLLGFEDFQRVYIKLLCSHCQDHYLEDSVGGATI